MKEKIKIVYLEHLRSDADLIEMKLKDANVPFECLPVYTKEEFLTALKQFTPDIVFADHYVSAFNRTQALNIVLKNIINIPFILISAMVPEDMQELINTETSGYIGKDRLHLLPDAIFNSPGHSKIVIEKLKLSNASLPGTIVPKQENNIVPEMLLSNESIYDLSMLEEMDDNDYLIDIISVFLNESSKDLNEIQKAYTYNNADKINKQAHKLKGSAGLIQANQFSDILAQIEQSTKQGIISESLSALIENAREQYKKLETALKKRLAQTSHRV